MKWIQRLSRLWRHRWTEGQVQSTFPAEVLKHLENHITASESQHTGQVQVCVEGGLPYSYIWRQASARERAVNLFGKFGTWDTEHNNGVLIYLLMADHSIEIVADRGITKSVPPATWHHLTQDMRQAFQQGEFVRGVEQAIDQVSTLLTTHFPRHADTPTTDETGLPNAPIVQGRFFKDT